MGVLRWLFGPPGIREPRPDHVVEVAWLPLWQAQLVLHELWEHDIPAVMSEDFSSIYRCSAREPMARLFVMEPRLPRATALIEAVTGHPPARQDR